LRKADERLEVEGNNEGTRASKNIQAKYNLESSGRPAVETRKVEQAQPYEYTVGQMTAADAGIPTGVAVNAADFYPRT
jgi:hypothetical protein